MVWHYHDDDVSGPDARVLMTVDGLDPRAQDAVLAHYRIDQLHSNSYAAWQRLGSPVAPDEAQYAGLEQDGRLQELGPAEPVPLRHGAAMLEFGLPRQAVSLLILTVSKP